MQDTIYKTGIHPWYAKSRETCLSYRRSRGETISVQERDYLRSLFQDIYWFGITITTSDFVCYKGPVPVWAFAEQPSARRAMETYRYLVALYARTGDMLCELAELAIGLLTKTSTDDTGKTSILEAMLSYGDTERTGPHTDRLVDEVFEAIREWDRMCVIETYIDGDTPFEIVSYRNGEMTFGFQLDKGEFRRVAIGQPAARSSEAFLLSQYRLAEKAVETSLSGFSHWVEVARDMHPAIALRRVLVPVQLRLIDDLAGYGYRGSIGNCDDCVDADQDYVEWTDGAGSRSETKDLMLLGGLSREEANKTTNDWLDDTRTLRQIANQMDPLAL